MIETENPKKEEVLNSLEESSIKPITQERLLALISAELKDKSRKTIYHVVQVVEHFNDADFTATVFDLLKPAIRSLEPWNKSAFFSYVAKTNNQKFVPLLLSAMTSTDRFSYYLEARDAILEIYSNTSEDVISYASLYDVAWGSKAEIRVDDSEPIFQKKHLLWNELVQKGYITDKGTLSSKGVNSSNFYTDDLLAIPLSITERFELSVLFKSLHTTEAFKQAPARALAILTLAKLGQDKGLSLDKVWRRSTEQSIVRRVAIYALLDRDGSEVLTLKLMTALDTFTWRMDFIEDLYFLGDVEHYSDYKQLYGKIESLLQNEGRSQEYRYETSKSEEALSQLVSEIDFERVSFIERVYYGIRDWLDGKQNSSKPSNLMLAVQRSALSKLENSSSSIRAATLMNVGNSLYRSPIGGDLLSTEQLIILLEKARNMLLDEDEDILVQIHAAQLLVRSLQFEPGRLTFSNHSDLPSCLAAGLLALDALNNKNPHVQKIAFETVDELLQSAFFKEAEKQSYAVNALVLKAESSNNPDEFVNTRELLWRIAKETQNQNAIDFIFFDYLSNPTTLRLQPDELITRDSSNQSREFLRILKCSSSRVSK
jgi:hypothetical protein